MLTEAQIAEFERLEKAATPGENVYIGVSFDNGWPVFRMMEMIDIRNAGVEAERDLFQFLRTHARALLSAARRCVGLDEALRAWDACDAESADQTPVPDLALRARLRSRARLLTKEALKETP